MNVVQQRLADLEAKGWTLAAIADALGVTYNAAQKWKAGDRHPSNLKSVLEHLERLQHSPRIPKQRRYPQGRAHGTERSR